MNAKDNVTLGAGCLLMLAIVLRFLVGTAILVGVAYAAWHFLHKLW